MTLETGAPSAGAEVAAESSSPSPSVDYSLSDSDLFDQVVSGEAPAEAAPAETPAADANPDAEGKTATPSDKPTTEEKPQEGEVEQEAEIESLPEGRKRLFKEDPGLRRAYFLQKRLEETGLTWEEMREYRDNFQSIDDLREAAKAARSLYALSNDFLGGNDEAQDRFLDALNQISPEATRRLVHRISSRMPALDPEAYQGDAAAKLELALGNLEGLWQDDDYKLDRLREFRGLVDEELKRVPRGQKPQDVARVPDDGTAKAAIDTTSRELSNIVDGVLAAYKSPAYTPEIRAEMKDKILGATVRSLLNNPTFEFQANAILGDRTKPMPDRLSALAAFVKTRAQRVVAMNAAKVVGPFEKALRAAGSERLSSAQRLAARRESPGAPAGTGTAPVKIDYRTMSDMDILNALSGS